MQLLTGWILAVLSGGLLAACYPPLEWGDTVWFALMPLVWNLWFHPGGAGRRPVVRAAAAGYVSGLVFFAASAFWLTTLTWPGYVALALLFALYFAAWAGFVAWLVAGHREEDWLRSAHNLRVSLVGAASWTALEWVRSQLFPYFGWNGLGIAQHANLPLIQIADVAGVGGVSFLICWANLMGVATLKRLILETGRGARRPHWDFAVTIAAVALAWTYGLRQILSEPPPAEKVSFAAIQSDIPQSVRNNPDEEMRVLEILKEQTGTAQAMAPDLILWPESATPSPLFSHPFTLDLVRELAAESPGDFLLGTVVFSDAGDFNSIVLLTKNGTEAQIHHKMHLVPFGEYVPFRRELPFLADWLSGLIPDDFDAGTTPNILEMAARPVRMGPLVCFEDTVPALSRKFAQLGAQMLVVVTNDGWFLESAGSRQHLLNAVFRCAESKLPMIRAANTGVTCSIDRFGAVRDMLTDGNGQTFLRGVLFGRVEVPSNPVTTFHTRYGEVFSIACASLSLLALLIPAMRRKKCPCPGADETKPSLP